MSSHIPTDEALKTGDRIDEIKKTKKKNIVHPSCACCKHSRPLALPDAKVVGRPGTGSNPAPSPDPTSHMAHFDKYNILKDNQYTTQLLKEALLWDKTSHHHPGNRVQTLKGDNVECHLAGLWESIWQSGSLPVTVQAGILWHKRNRSRLSWATENNK